MTAWAWSWSGLTARSESLGLLLGSTGKHVWGGSQNQ